MLASRPHEPIRRGIVLVLVLAMLGLLALIGITFATFAGQARINARNFSQSIIQPQDDELMDFALAQLITDTGDPRSVIRGHSLGRDMYGSDANNNGYLATSPSAVNPGPMQITNVTSNGMTGNTASLTLTTNIASTDPAFYGYNFTKWVMRVSYTGTVPTGLLKPVDQTLEIQADSTSNANRQFTVTVGPYTPVVVNTTTTHLLPPALYNPTLGSLVMSAMDTFLYNQASTNLPWIFEVSSANTSTIPNAIPASFYEALNSTNAQTYFQNLSNYTFTLDSRWMHAFNGPGMGTQSTTISINNVNYTVPNSTYGNFRFNGLSPSSPGMDEDYDACDLENWFLSIQSADGQVVIPSFHRPGIVRYVSAPTTSQPLLNYDWNASFRLNNPDSLSRILRPVAADGHDATAFPDLVPDPTTGRITYDVDNDGDGITDSVWLDLGYPARRDSRGQLYKPLFAFMVVGLNGRIPLNTAGNLAGANETHALHLGSSVSEVDPTYALQNANQGPSPYPNGPATDNDPFNANASTANNYANFPNVNLTSNTQTDVNGNDVRITQLQNLLAGTRPQPDPLNITDVKDDSGNILNGDRNVLFGNFTGNNSAQPYYMPNGTSQLTSPFVSDIQYGTSGFAAQGTPAVAGRWGESQSIPGYPIVDSSGNYHNLLQATYSNPVRAGYSYDISDLLSGSPRDAADDNFNMFDPFPLGHTGEMGDSDLYDPAGALALPIDRMRRFVTPADINGTGGVRRWTGTSTSGTRGSGSNLGADYFGRVMFSSYFRPPGAPGLLNTNYNVTYATGGNTTTAEDMTTNAGAVIYPSSGATNLYDSAPYPPRFPTATITASAAPYDPRTNKLTSANYLPDLTNNPLHGFEAAKFPDLYTAASGGSYSGSSQNNGRGSGGIQANLAKGGTLALTGATVGNMIPTTFPTYDKVNQNDGLNEADEMNLYNPNPLLDSPFGPSDLEWLYRQQDVDGASLTSRLSQLAPVSFTNQIDGQRRAHLFSTDSWELNNFVYANDNPSGLFQYNHRFNTTGNAQLATTAGAAVTNPGLTARNKKINLNYPLPVSNDPHEPIRQKWIADTYYTLKAVLPPRAVDTAEELAQLSQFVINIVDFRDPDCAITIWTNPDVNFTPGTLSGTATGTGGTTTPIPATPPQVALNTTSTGTLVQYGMEYNPVAINETLAYSFRNSGGTRFNRVFVELVNTLTQTAFSTPGTAPTTGASSYPSSIQITDASMLDLGGFNSAWAANVSTAATNFDPYIGGSWDIIFTADDVASRPDPIRGDLTAPTTPASLSGSGATVNPSYFGLLPLAGLPTGSGSTATFTNDVVLTPLGPQSTMPPTQQTPAPAGPAPPNYFFVIGNTISNNAYETPAATTGSGSSMPWTSGTPACTGMGTVTPTFGQAVTQLINTAFDPANAATGTGTGSGTGTGTGTTTSTPIQWYPGVLPGVTQNTAPTNYSPTLNPPPYATGATGGGAGSATGSAYYYWVCLRRPANLFAPVSASNPMIVVDSMRFPYIEGTTQTATTGGSGSNTQTKNSGNILYSAQRMQPFRGGHAVPNAASMAAGTGSTAAPVIDSRYGFTEQIAIPATVSATQGIFNTSNASGTPTPISTGSLNNAATNPIYHTLGLPNDFAEPWDYFPFNDRDFTSVAELMLVPSCPPGLFTKQFVEFSPSQIDPTVSTGGVNLFTLVKPQLTPPAAPPSGAATGATMMQTWAAATGTGTSTTPPLARQLSSSITNYGLCSPPLTYGTVYWQGGSSLAASSSLGTITAHTYPYLADQFFYTGASLPIQFPSSELDHVNTTGATVGADTAGTSVNTAASDGWARMLEFFEVPSQSMGAYGLVAQGTNFDWARQDVKPGLLNLNLIIDEEPFFSVVGRQTATNNVLSQSLLNYAQMPPILSGSYAMPLGYGGNPSQPQSAGGSPLPMVVSAIDPTGTPTYCYPTSNVGVTEADPILSVLNTNTGFTGVDSRMKAAFAQFLWNRHGGSGYMFGFGNGAVGQNYTVPPAVQPTSLPTATNVLSNYAAYGTGIPFERPFHSLSYPDIDFTIMRPATLPPSPYTDPVPNGAPSYTASPVVYYAGDPGVRNPLLYPGSGTGATSPVLSTTPMIVATASAPGFPTNPTLPPPIPPRRFFQIPDASPPTTSGLTNTESSNASEPGDPFINNVQPANNATYPATLGALPPYSYNTGTSTLLFAFNNNYPTIMRTPIQPATGGTTPTAVTIGSGSPSVGATPPTYTNPGQLFSAEVDARLHPSFRTELIERVMNLTTVRTHQYAVWITVGFFEIKKQGDLSMLAYSNPLLAFDVMGPEVGTVGGNNVRYRGFFLVDRTKLTGFNPNSTGSFRAAVTYRKVIQ